MRPLPTLFDFESAAAAIARNPTRTEIKRQLAKLLGKGGDKHYRTMDCGGMLGVVFVGGGSHLTAALHVKGDSLTLTCSRGMETGLHATVTTSRPHRLAPRT